MGGTTARAGEPLVRGLGAVLRGLTHDPHLREMGGPTGRRFALVGHYPDSVLASHTNQEDDACMAGEAQSDHSIEEVDIDALFAKFKEQVEESSDKATCKGKGKA
uniref:Uncharacterized protein n=1 Tax=Solanum tuberosum TaxID=4113 RepID=M1DDF8_SOLTU